MVHESVRAPLPSRARARWRGLLSAATVVACRVVVCLCGFRFPLSPALCHGHCPCASGRGARLVLFAGLIMSRVFGMEGLRLISLLRFGRHHCNVIGLAFFVQLRAVFFSYLFARLAGSPALWGAVCLIALDFRPFSGLIYMCLAAPWGFPFPD